MEKVRKASSEKQATRKRSSLAATATKPGSRSASRVAATAVVVPPTATGRRARVVQSAAAKPPTESASGVSAAEVALRARVNRMGLLLDPAAEINVVIGTIVEAGLCHGISQRWQRLGPDDPDQRQELLKSFHQLLEDSPTPAGEWPGMREVCGDELLGQILSISHASLRRYAAGERRCPDGVAARLHWLALVVEALEGSYNAIGIRRWFERPRQALDGVSPLALLEGTWLPEHQGPQRLKALAEAAQAGMVAS